jgi:hypothetical protein
MLARDGCLFRIRIVPKDTSELVVAADDAKCDRLNGVANTLFYRDFEEGGGCVVADISLPEDRPSLTCLALFAQERGKVAVEMRGWQLETAARLAAQLRETVAVFDVSRRHVRDERSRANINLARNLGHDLTNIIATSKLDILTVSKILGDGAGGMDLDARRGLLGELREYDGLAEETQRALTTAEYLYGAQGKPAGGPSLSPPTSLIAGT